MSKVILTTLFAGPVLLIANTAIAQENKSICETSLSATTLDFWSRNGYGATNIGLPSAKLLIFNHLVKFPV